MLASTRFASVYKRNENDFLLVVIMRVTRGDKIRCGMNQWVLKYIIILNISISGYISNR